MEVNHAKRASNILCRSINELCVLDHKDDPNVIAKWVSNKTPEHILKWIASPGTYMLTASINDTVVGVGSFGNNGEIFLNFVSPDYRFQGISKKLLTKMEYQIEQLGIENATLYSTITALDFYKKAGWTEFGAPNIEFGIKGYPMIKKIST